jgi:hypothetical protein
MALRSTWPLVLGQLIPNAMTRAVGRFYQCRVTASERLGGGAEGSISSDVIGWGAAGSPRGVRSSRCDAAQKGQALHVVDEVRKSNLCCRPGDADGADYEAHPRFVRRRHA